MSWYFAVMAGLSVTYGMVGSWMETSKDKMDGGAPLAVFVVSTVAAVYLRSYGF